jgi:hypothetical protein
MYLVIDNGRLYVTNSDEASLRLAQRRAGHSFHFEPIPYGEVSIARRHRTPEEQSLIEQLAKASRRKGRLADQATINQTLDLLMEELGSEELR